MTSIVLLADLGRVPQVWTLGFTLAGHRIRNKLWLTVSMHYQQQLKAQCKSCCVVITQPDPTHCQAGPSMQTQTRPALTRTQGKSKQKAVNKEKDNAAECMLCKDEQVKTHLWGWN